MKKIVISGINLFEGGALTVYKECLDSLLNECKVRDLEVTAFVHNEEDFNKYKKQIKIIQLPKSRKSYLYRLWYEYIYFYKYSNNKEIDVWISIHDITPNVKAKKRYVYCHNPSPFMKTELSNLKYSYKNFLFSIFYKYLYKINIKKNTAVIVQQNWIRDEFKKMYNIENIIVAKPNISNMDINNEISTKYSNKKNNKYKFIFPAYPRFFKNFEVICEATRILNDKMDLNFEVYLTINGKENKYAKDIYDKYRKVENIKFIGIQERESLLNLYNEIDSLIFPSKLETWGLPITEFKRTGKSIILPKLPYAYETIGTYNKVNFFNPNDASELAEIMLKQINNECKYESTKEKKIEGPYARCWKELIDIILN